MTSAGSVLSIWHLDALHAWRRASSHGTAGGSCAGRGAALLPGCFCASTRRTRSKENQLWL